MLLTDEQFLAAVSWVLDSDGGVLDCLRSIQENRNFFPVATYRLSKWDDARNKPVPSAELSDEVRGWYVNRPKKKQRKYTLLDAPQVWEERICVEADVPLAERWKVVVTVPAFDAKQERESGARLLLHAEHGYRTEDLFNVSPVMKAIVTNLIPAREVIRVLASEELGDALVHQVREASHRVFRSG